MSQVYHLTYWCGLWYETWVNTLKLIIVHLLYIHQRRALPSFCEYVCRDEYSWQEQISTSLTGNVRAFKVLFGQDIIMFVLLVLDLSTDLTPTVNRVSDSCEIWEGERIECNLTWTRAWTLLSDSEAFWRNCYKQGIHFLLFSWQG